MEFNNGKATNSANITDSKRAQAAREFSEGSKFLEQCLLKLWEQNIQTQACCSGRKKDHEKKDEAGDAYISILIEEKNKEQILKLAEKLILSKTCSVEIGIQKNLMENACGFLNLRKNILFSRTSNKMFSKVLNCLSPSFVPKPQKAVSDFLVIASDLLDSKINQASPFDNIEMRYGKLFKGLVMSKWGVLPKLLSFKPNHIVNILTTINQNVIKSNLFKTETSPIFAERFKTPTKNNNQDLIL